MAEASAVALAWLSYACAYFAVPPRSPRLARRAPRAFVVTARALGVVCLGWSAWIFGAADGLALGALLALLAWTTAASVFPAIATIAPRSAYATVALAALVSLGAIHGA